MRRQQSAYVVFGGIIDNPSIGSDLIGKPKTFEEYSREKQWEDDPWYAFLEKVRVPHKKKEEIRHELKLIGIHEGTLFPELEHQL